MEPEYRELQVANNELDMQKTIIFEQIVKVYIIQESNTKVVNESTAEVLFLKNQECIMIADEKYYVITDKLIEMLEKTGYDIDYVELKFNKEQNKILLFSENDGFYVDLSVLNLLNTIDSKKLDFDKNKYGPLTHDEFRMLKTNYNVDFVKDDSINNDISEFKKI